MNTYKAVLMTAFLGVLLLATVIDATAAERRRGRCEGSHKVAITDLDMSPDPITEGQRVRRWRVRLRVDSNGECDTVIEIREKPGNELVAREREYRLRPGINEVELEPQERYRFEGKQRCFVVLVDIAGTRRPIDAGRHFCASHRPSYWTMREEGDERIRKEKPDRDRDRDHMQKDRDR